MKTVARAAPTASVAEESAPRVATPDVSNAEMQDRVAGEAAAEEGSFLDSWAGLEPGSENEEAVESLQQRLVDHDVGHLMGGKPVDGDFGNGTTKGITRFQQLNGLKATGELDATTRAELGPEQAAVYGDFQGLKRPSDAVIEAGKQTELGKKLPEALDANLETYERASQLTGVPVELLVMIHANESQYGTDDNATKGKEVGWGLDPDWVSTKWGSQQLAQVERINELEAGSLGSWNRNDEEGSRLQNAIVAAEHLKRNAAYADVPIHEKMTQKDLAGALGAWRAGPTAGKKAHASGKHHLFDPSITDTPHAYHPGGQSHGKNGRRSVKSGIKEGSLRGDVLLPILQDELKQRREAEAAP